MQMRKRQRERDESLAPYLLLLECHNVYLSATMPVKIDQISELFSQKYVGLYDYICRNLKHKL